MATSYIRVQTLDTKEVS